MSELIVSLALHCVVSFLLKYCYDKEFIWHNNEKSPNLHMPKLYDLNENSGICNQQRYVEHVIVPAKDYFLKLSDIEHFQTDNDCEDLLTKYVTYTSTILLVSNALRKNNLFPFVWLNLVVALVVCIVTSYIISIVYKRTKLKLNTFELSVSDLKERFYHVRKQFDDEYDISEENALNNFIISEHYSYIKYVYYTIQNRNYIKGLIKKIAAIVYFLFFMRIPD